MASGKGTASMFFGGTPTDEASATVTGLTGMLPGDHAEAWFQHDDSTSSNDAAAHEEAAAVCILTCSAGNNQMTVKAECLAGLITGFLLFHYGWSN